MKPVVWFRAGVAVALTATWTCLAAAGVRMILDLPYVTDADAAQRLDLRIPERSGGDPLPVVILVHGGGWSGGDKSGAEKPNSGADITPWFAPLARTGFLVVSTDHRLAPAHRWPACLDDTRAAVTWVHRHIAEYGGDPERIALMGHSAGGHLAPLAALPTADGSTPIRAVVGCAAVSDLVSDTQRRGGPSTSLHPRPRRRPLIDWPRPRRLNGCRPLFRRRFCSTATQIKPCRWRSRWL